MNQGPEKHLIESFRQGDELAFNQLVLKYRKVTASQGSVGNSRESEACFCFRDRHRKGDISKRAGADLILTYFAKDVAREL